MNTESWERLAWRGVATTSNRPICTPHPPHAHGLAGPRCPDQRAPLPTSQMDKDSVRCGARALVVVVLGVDRDGWGGTERKGKRPSGPPRPACVVWWRGAERSRGRRGRVATRHAHGTQRTSRPARGCRSTRARTSTAFNAGARAEETVGGGVATRSRRGSRQAAKRPRSPADADTWPGPHDGLASNGPLPSNVPSSRRAVPLHSALRFTLLLLLTSSPAPRHFTW